MMTTNTNTNKDVSREVCKQLFDARREFEDNLRTAKAVVFKKVVPFKSTRYITVLCCVPSHALGNCKLSIHETEDGIIKKHPMSTGTFIRVLGDSNLMIPDGFNTVSFTKYSAYLNSVGYQFAFPVKDAHGENIRQSFRLCKVAISAAKQISR